MTTTEDKPVDRDAWRRLLDGGTDGPPELTDVRIRAKARQALTPRAGRWWLPASLAASMLLAILVVQQQYERPRAPAVVSEADYAAATAESPAAAELERAAPREGAERQEDLRNLPPDAAVVPPPQVELPALEESRVSSGVAADAAPANTAPPPAAQAPAAKREDDVSDVVVTGSRQRSADTESSTPVTQATSADIASQGVTGAGALMKSGEAARSPEEWYAEIEKLRAAGKKREAGRQLKELEEAHPGWLEKNHPTDR